MRGAAKTLSATYFWPFQSHASLGPSCAVADVRADGSATVWCASQGIHGLRTNLAKVFGLPPEKMRVIFLDGSGSYGTNGGDHVAADALLLSKTVGQPVRVQWMRHDEHGWDPKGPQQLLDVRAGLDARRTNRRVGDRDVGAERGAGRARAARGRRRAASRRSTAPAPARSRRTAILPTTPTTSASSRT